MNYIMRQGRRIEIETIETCLAPKNMRLRRRKHFVRFPLKWAERLAESSSAAGTYRLALHLLYRHWEECRAILLARKSNAGERRREPLCKMAGVGRAEQLDLISIERRFRRSPRITVHP